MVMLMVGVTVAAVIALGWVGHRASIRIEAWGRGMDACDEIFRLAEGYQEQQMELQPAPKIPPAVATHGIHFGAVK
jgi:hypothetical protein